MKKLFLKKSFPISLLIIYISLVSCSQGQKLPEKAKEVALEVLNKPMIIEIQSIKDFYYNPSWTPFLIKEGYLERGIKKNGRETYNVTSKLRPFIVSESSSISPFLGGFRSWIWNVKVAKYQVKSIDKVEKIIHSDYDLWKFSFTYFLEPLLPELPTFGPYKGYTGASFDRWKEEWTRDIFEADASIKADINEYYNKWVGNLNDKTAK